MKKFISMVMAAAMVVSLVPATAFAAEENAHKVVKAVEYTEKEAVFAANAVAGTRETTIAAAITIEMNFFMVNYLLLKFCFSLFFVA